MTALIAERVCQLKQNLLQLFRQEIMDSVNRSGKFDTKFQGFTGTDGPLGKKMENSRTRSEIGWEPKYPSFTEFLGLDS
jgi:nucleoside-diphosphate-sugar epimerase